ncbi:hypothetical protein TYRP_016298 [Tyrophagus putrescentiae]|nr:hypothetical protein TYRP_016298 [Tyrophagus putrescentiae]
MVDGRRNSRRSMYLVDWLYGVHRSPNSEAGCYQTSHRLLPRLGEGGPRGDHLRADVNVLLAVEVRIAKWVAHDEAHLVVVGDAHPLAPLDIFRPLREEVQVPRHIVRLQLVGELVGRTDEHDVAEEVGHGLRPPGGRVPLFALDEQRGNGGGLRLRQPRVGAHLHDPLLNLFYGRVRRNGGASVHLRHLLLVQHRALIVVIDELVDVLAGNGRHKRDRVVGHQLALDAVDRLEGHLVQAADHRLGPTSEANRSASASPLLYTCFISIGEPLWRMARRKRGPARGENM